MSSSDAALRVGVIGLGVMGRQHVRVLHAIPEVNLVVACDPSSEARAAVEANFGVPTVSDWRAGMGHVDAVINATPTGLHFEMTKALLEMGLHVLVEKPMAETPEEAARLIDLAAAQGVVLLAGHTERFNPAVTALKQVIDAGQIGDVIAGFARRVGVARPVVPHVNVVLDLAVHDMDVFAHLLSQQGQMLIAIGKTMGENKLEDHVDLVVRYGNATAVIQANWITPVKIRHLSLTGSKGSAELDYIEQTVRVYESVPELIKGTPRDFFAVSSESEPSDIPVVRGEPLKAELRHFVDSIRGRAAPMSLVSIAHTLRLAREATEMMQEADQ